MLQSPPSRRRGLKSCKVEDLPDEKMSPPSRRRGLKFRNGQDYRGTVRRLRLGGVD